MSKKRIPTRMKAIGLGLGLVAGVGAGLALEASGTSSAAAPSVAIAADSTANDAVPMGADRQARLQSILQPLVDAGTITQAQADSVIAALVAAGPVGGPLGDVHGRGIGGGHHGSGLGDGRMGQRLETIADTIGISADDLATALAAGQTIAEVAEANGSSAQAVIDALVAEVEAHVADEVAAGEHTQADADARLAEATARITAAVNNGGPLSGPGHRGALPDSDDGAAGTGGSIDGGPTDTTVATGA